MNTQAKVTAKKIAISGMTVFVVKNKVMLAKDAKTGRFVKIKTAQARFEEYKASMAVVTSNKMNVVFLVMMILALLSIVGAPFAVLPSLTILVSFFVGLVAKAIGDVTFSKYWVIASCKTKYVRKVV